MRFLVDANVLSEATKPEPIKSVVEWLERNEADIVVNPIILGELHYGIVLLNPGRRRESLRKWLLAAETYLPVLDLDAATGRVWASLLAELKRKGRAMPIKDSLIAATAKQFNLTVATRNTIDFAHSGVKVVNPFKT